ncbi:HAD family hydrolase [Paenibacillus paeoniae]|uniref:HAD family hydrolase n=1 Tax=Paenibacillus paeoniae TaxID=2292705 RepID=A0A371PEL1_9BACL|nr:HAD-IA family hydrolase [Paenibacillus paeoniae]REK74355.1 HAD family hydrolase [Paenibacillus paeoniae]
MIKAMIFDFDGTIIDTETPWFYAFRDAYKEHGVELTSEQYSQCVGTHNHTFNPYKYLITELGLPVDEEKLRSKIHADHTALMEKEVVREGILDYLKLAKEAGLRIGLATSSDRSWIDRHLEALGIGHYFEVICTSDDVSQVKPDPELYVKAMEKLGVKPHEAIAIEDSPNGARAAAAAGMSCVIVPNSLTKLLSFDQEPGYIHAESLAKVDFAELVSRNYE